ncbi:MAG: diphosphomevalonate decarboxylase [Pseudomonadota bacterium]
MEVIAEAGPNIALVKYWGKRPGPRNLPAAGSLSITLGGLCATTRVRASSAAEDSLLINEASDPQATGRARSCLTELREVLDASGALDVVSAVNFPVAAGLASSAAGFAALTVAAHAYYGGTLGAEALARIAGHTSGSAARSLFGGFVELAAPRHDGDDIRVGPLADAGHWPLAVVVAVTEHGRKPIGSGAAMRRTAQTSPYYPAWLESQDDDLALARAAVMARDFQKLADVAEANCLKMHATLLAARPGIVYFNAATVDAIARIRALRAAGTAVFFTVDAGPQVKAVCLPDAAVAVAAALREIRGVEDVTTVALGAAPRLRT